MLGSALLVLLQVMASLGGDKTVTIWNSLGGTAAINSYITKASASLLKLKRIPMDSLASILILKKAFVSMELRNHLG
jgi:hypothetical protein